MVALMGSTKDQSELYKFEGSPIEILPYFLYEISVDKVWSKGFCNLKTKYFKSTDLLKIKNKVEVKNYDNYKVIRSITLIGAPYVFIKECKLPTYNRK